MKDFLHPEGPEFSKIISGMWRLMEWDYSTPELTRWVEQCIEMGVTTFDHADIYGDYMCEKEFGKVLADQPRLREEMELVTKCGICPISDKHPSRTVTHYDTSAEYIVQSAEQSLKNLHTDFVDLLLIHRPSPKMIADEIAEGFSRLIESGKIRYGGVSNFTPSQFELIQSAMDTPLVTNQVQCSLLHLDPIYDGTFDQAQQMGSKPMLWSPMSGGDLFNGSDKRSVRVREALKKVSAEHDCEPDQTALSWLNHLPSNPFIILGTGKIHRIRKAVESLSISLELQEWFALLEASQGEPVP